MIQVWEMQETAKAEHETQSSRLFSITGMYTECLALTAKEPHDRSVAVERQLRNPQIVSLRLFE